MVPKVIKHSLEAHNIAVMLLFHPPTSCYVITTVFFQNLTEFQNAQLFQIGEGNRASKPVTAVANEPRNSPQVEMPSNSTEINPLGNVAYLNA